MGSSIPAGWPAELPPPGTQEFAEKAVGWLLDRCPAEVRGSGLEHQPVVLAYVTEQHVVASAEGLRSAYARLRAELGGSLEPAAVTRAQHAIERIGAHVAQQCREVALVREAIDASSPRIAQ